MTVKLATGQIIFMGDQKLARQLEANKHRLDRKNQAGHQRKLATVRRSALSAESGPVRSCPALSGQSKYNQQEQIIMIFLINLNLQRWRCFSTSLAGDWLTGWLAWVFGELIKKARCLIVEI